MVEKITPEANKVYFMEAYTLVHILSGVGHIQVDFKDYHDWQDKAIFLEKGQYLKFFSDNFVIRKIEFSDQTVFENKEVRVLFKHLIALGYIDLLSCEECQGFLQQTVFSATSDIIDISSRHWYWQNPFNAQKEEYHIIFDLKEVIDQKFKNHLTNRELSDLIGARGYQAQALYKSKVGLSVKSSLNQKRLLEAQKEVAFTQKDIQQIAYELGFKDPAYFNRVFKQSFGQSPRQFRESFAYRQQDIFVQQLYELLREHHGEQRQLNFYADRMNMSVKTLSKKVKNQLHISLGQLIRQELIQTSKELLGQELKIKEVAYRLGFEEANHFSAFFKQYTGLSPSVYLEKKYNH